MKENRVMDLFSLLNKKLRIPNYQRPYEWEKKNVYILLDDIYKSFSKNERINLGTIILYKKDNDYEIVDGQQRLITLSLLIKVLDINYNINLLDEKILCISSSEERIYDNYNSIIEFVTGLEKYEKIDFTNFINYIKNSINFYVLETKDANEAFQLFDGRNSKYRDLTPVDLLKAYHLGELPRNYPLNKKRDILKTWDKNIEQTFSIDESCNKIDYLYNNIIFNIYNWSLNKSIQPFSKEDIYLYKGYHKEDNYSFVKYYNNNRLYQINKPFKSGEDFFYMTSKFIKDFDNTIQKYNLKKKINISIDEYLLNFRFINYLYYGALFAFHDKFGDNIPIFYMEAIEDYIYKYSIILRVKNRLVNLESLNYYVLNTKENFFFRCNNALKVEELLKLDLEEICNRPNKKEKLGKMRNKLWKELI